MVGIFKGYVFFTTWICFVLTEVEGFKCYHNKWLEPRNRIPKDCGPIEIADPSPGARWGCYVFRNYYKSNSENQKFCESYVNNLTLTCSEWHCHCGRQGCNRSFESCLKSLGRSNDPSCNRKPKKVHRHRTLKCYHDLWLSFKKNELKECSPPADPTHLNYCIIFTHYDSTVNKTYGGQKVCSNFYPDRALNCYDGGCRCAEDGCNKDYKTCVASLGRSDDPECQMRQKS